MSYSVQTTGQQAASIDNPTPNDGPSNTTHVSTLGAFVVKHLTVGSLEMGDGEDHISEAFEDHIPLRMALFMNWLLNTEYYQDLELVTLRPSAFRMINIDQESEIQTIFNGTANQFNDLFAFTKPALSICANSKFGKNSGTAGMSLAITGIDERERQQTAIKVAVALKDATASFHAANILVFGDECTTKDLSALSMTIDPSNTIHPKLRRTAEQLQDSCGRSPIKCTLRYIDGKCVVGYTRDGEDITDSLLRSHLKPVLDELHDALLQACRSACTCGTQIVAVCDGFTFIAARLYNVQLVDGVVQLAEANFSSHSALDLTTDGSNIKLFNFFSYFALEDAPLRSLFQQILHRSGEFLGGSEFNMESANELRDLISIEMRSLRVDSNLYTLDQSLIDGDNIF